jgi:hypothetical protein
MITHGKIEDRQAQLAWRRVLRGGSFDNPPENLRSANRDNDQPEDRDENDGFRCVRVPQHAVMDNAMQRLPGPWVPHSGAPVPVALRPSGRAFRTCGTA